jgi:TonB family protein
MRVLLAFDNGRGIVYARPSGWQRVYLLWTFRNFRSLPQKLLNPRQQDLVAALYRTSAIERSREFDDGVIGTVEEFRLQPSAPGCDAHGRLVLNPAEKNLTVAHCLKFDEPGEPSYTQPAFSRMSLRIGAGALLVLVAAFAWYQMRAQLAFTAGTTTAGGIDVRAIDAAANPHAADAGNARAESTASPKVESPAAPLPRPVAIQAANAQASTLASLERSPAPVRLSAWARASSLVSGEATRAIIPAPADQPRMLISGPPRKMVYPVCPATDVRGKVSLRAVIDHNGGVSQVQVLTGSHVLAAAAIAAVRQWSYAPSSQDIPTGERETNITVAFISNEVVAVSFPNPAALNVRQITTNAAPR